MYMFKYICKRLGLMILTFTIIFVTCFVLIKLLPVDFRQASPGQDPDKAKAIWEARGYDRPILEQLYTYIKRIVTKWDFGIALNMKNVEYNSPVWDEFIKKLPPTILINIYSSLLAVPVGIALGIYAALKKNKWQDHFISTIVMVFISVPGFVVALLFLYFICFKAGMFEMQMNAGYDYFSWSMFKSMLPAVFCMSFGSIAGYARFTRAELTEVLTSEFMLLARTKGLTKRQATKRHALRNAMVPIFPSIVGEFISVLSGSLILEKIFGIPGVGRLYLTAINAPDYDFFMLLSGFYLLIGLLAGLVIDPRIRMGAK